MYLNLCQKILFTEFQLIVQQSGCNFTVLVHSHGSCTATAGSCCCVFPVKKLLKAAKVPE